MASAGISQEVADLLREKHGFTFEKGGAFMSPTGAQVPIMMKEGGIVPGYEPGGYVDPIFAAQRANNEKARAEQEALDAYKASLATAGPTPLEIARAGYLADQASAPAAAPFGPLPAAAAVADPNRPGMMMGEAGPVQAPMQTMDIGEPTFSGGSPVAEVPVFNPSISDNYVAPVADTGGISAVVPDPVFVPLDNPNASMADVKQNGLDQLMALANQTAASNQQLSDQLGFGSGVEAIPPEPELTSVQQVAAELKGLVDTVGLSSRSKKRNDDRIVFFNDGTKTSDILKKYGVTMDEWRDATKVPGGITGGISNREQAVDRVVSGIEYALMSDQRSVRY